MFNWDWFRYSWKCKITWDREIGKNNYIEDRIALLKVLKHINCIIDNYSSYEDNESIYNEYVELRKLIFSINFFLYEWP